MAAVPEVADFVLETTTTEGAGDIVLAGAPGVKYRTWRSAFSDGAEVYYAMAQEGGGFEVGKGTLVYGGADSIQRDEVLASSNGGAAVVWSSGTKVVYSTYPASTIQVNVGAGRFWGIAAKENSSVTAEVFVAVYDSNLVFIPGTGTGDFVGHDLKVARWDPETSEWVEFFDIFDGDMLYDHDTKVWHVGRADGDDGLIDRIARVSRNTGPEVIETGSDVNLGALELFEGPDEVLVIVDSSTPRTITLPPVGAGNDGYRATVKNIGTANATVDTDGAEGIDGSSTYGPVAQWEWVSVVLVDGEWLIVGAG